MENKSNKTYAANRTKDIVLTGLLTALVFVSTYFIQFRLPISINGGLVHMGNVMLFATAIVFGPKKGAIAGAFGMGLFDIVSGWAAWAPFTFVIRGVMGLIVGSVANANGRNGENIGYNILGILISSVWMIGGYYVAEGILYGNWVAPVTSIPGNITQLVVGLVLGVPLAIALKKIAKRANLV